MRYSNIFCLAFIFMQTLITYASPIAIESDNLLKRSFPPFNARYTPVYFEKPQHWNDTVYAYIYSEDPNVKFYPPMEWPGRVMQNPGNGYQENEKYYSLNIEYGQFNKSHILFSDGQYQTPGVMQSGFDLIVNSVYGENGLIGTYNDDTDNYNSIEVGNYANIFYRPRNERNHYGSMNMKIYAHFKIGNGEWNSVPGKKMYGEPYSGMYYTTINLGDAEEFTICFTDGEGNWDNNHGQDFKFKKFQTYIIDQILDENSFIFKRIN
ncbi:carbohydrate-binding module family 25 protein [Piromyces sp. E2]|nr:carbohydrate-binding module family 25 protein [Piromyces sp. E2]|eukprot:OUM68729.1 carbohydrate-binding module family 25 protein [Piromyces sp. E2]